MNFRQFLLIVLTAVLLVLSFPLVNQSFLVWIALIPLLYAVEGKSVYRTFVLGWLSGFIFYIGLIYWIVVVTTTYGNLPYPLGILVMMLLAAYLTSYIGLSLACSRYIELHTGFSSSLLLPYIWVAMEYLRSFLFTGFPWESMGYSQYLSPLLIQFADITGVYGVSFLIIFINSTIFLFLRGIPTKKFPLKAIACSILLITSATLYGNWRLADTEKAVEASPSLSLALIQGNIDQGIKWNAAFREQAIATHLTLTEKAIMKGSRLIIWPEASTPFYFQSEHDYQQRILATVHDTNAYLLLGSPAFDVRKNRLLNFNSAFLLSPSENIIGRYDKMHLVPYGEYVPLKRFFPFINKLVAVVGNFSAGERFTVFSIPEGSFSTLICYEIIFPDLTRRFVRKGAQFLVNITNDAWFGTTSAPYQHLSMVVFRAVENKRYVARSANTGISAIIDPTGKINNSTPLFTEALITAKIRPLAISTFYTNHGDIFAILSSLFSLVMLTFAAVRRRTFHYRRYL